jgi:hypothetical protein
MSYPSDGRNHHNAVQSEKNLGLEYKPELEELYDKPISKVGHKGGTQNKEDNILTFGDTSDQKVSLKQKKKGLNVGSFDYVNTSAPIEMTELSSKIYKKFRGSDNVKNYKILTDSIDTDLNSADDDFVTELFRKNVVDKYENIDLIVVDEPNHELHKITPPSFDIVKNGGRLRIKQSTKPSMSRRIEGVDKDGNVVDAFLRVRLHLNNGKTKWLNGKSSSLVVKFQQDMVHKLV